MIMAKRKCEYQATTSTNLTILFMIWIRIFFPSLIFLQSYCICIMMTLQLIARVILLGNKILRYDFYERYFEIEAGIFERMKNQ